jgi:hypothetical protein
MEENTGAMPFIFWSMWFTIVGICGVIISLATVDHTYLTSLMQPVLEYFE